MLDSISNLINEIHLDLIKDYPFLQNWSVDYDNAKRRAGICRLTDKRISISRSHAQSNHQDVVKDTILHEFAHAIAYELYKETGHGKRWKQVATSIGATPKASGKFNLPSAPWLLVHRCSKSHQIKPISERYRRNKKIKSYFLTGKPDTKGELYFVAQSDFERFKQGLLDQSSLVLEQ